MRPRRGRNRNKKVGPDAWRTHLEGSTAGEVSHYGTCRSGSIGLILRFVPLGKSSSRAGSSRSSIAGVDANPATSSSSGAGSSSSIAGVEASPAASSSSIAGVDASRAGHCRTATMTGSSSSITGRGTARCSWCKPRLEGSRASYYRTATATATTTSSGGGSGSCIAG
ncbi:hypothetical protein PF007_g18431 [Phytophthora fragariae]|uniref:Uncharacterized protein n=1 Tax=Phytophthora fragariae TaxID=53985 RepID=A0A6A3R950_9STRA|nr:hypothetical protein PF007_g18431 [Phytophthora fragariae]